ncbi:MAG: hypothetical protein AVDCRST_MAG34-2987, partial [uncultured Nocardioidaceae bacterium]
GHPVPRLLLRRVRRRPDGALRRPEAGPRGVAVGHRDRPGRRGRRRHRGRGVQRARAAQQLPPHPRERGNPQHRGHHRPPCYRRGYTRRRPARRTGRHAVPPEGRQDRARPV